jgi:peptide deformylase
MELLKVLHFPDNRLRKKGKNIDIYDDNLNIIAMNMLHTMYECKGIGLAAVQVDIQIRLIVIDVSEERNEPLFLINPVINSKEDKIIFEEGCLSVPGFYEQVERFNEITYGFYDLKGALHESSASGLLAVCIQHEIDHLDGKLFVDYISNIKRDRIAKKMKKQESQGTVSTRKGIPYSI